MARRFYTAEQIINKLKEKEAEHTPLGVRNVDNASSGGYNSGAFSHRAFAETNMLRIRLRRVGAKKHPAYRIVVADSRSPRDGSFVDQVGHYDPMTDPPTIALDDAKIQEWLRKGAQPSEPVKRILRKREVAGEG